MPLQRLEKDLESLTDDGRSKLNEKNLELTNNPALTSLRLFVTTEYVVGECGIGGRCEFER